MTAPYVRVWLAQRITAIGDYLLDAWYTFRPGNAFWDDIPHAYRQPAPASGVAVDDGPEGAGSRHGDAGALTDLPLLRVCPVCNAHVGAPCITADNHTTGFHKRRKVATS